MSRNSYGTVTVNGQKRTNQVYLCLIQKNVSLEVNTVSLLRNPHKADKHEITLFAGFFPESFCQSKTIALASSRIRYQDKHPYIRYWSQSEKF